MLVSLFVTRVPIIECDNLWAGCQRHRYLFDTAEMLCYHTKGTKCTKYTSQTRGSAASGLKLSIDDYLREMKGPVYGNTPHFYSGDAGCPLWWAGNGVDRRFRSKETDAGEASALRMRHSGN